MTEQEFGSDVPDVIATANEIVVAAHADYEQESRLEIAFEVCETLRYQQSQDPWVHRLQNQQTAIQLQLNHEQLACISGVVHWVSPTFLGIVAQRDEYLVAIDSILAIGGLSEQVNLAPMNFMALHMATVWFHALQDDGVDATWLLVGSKSVSGQCYRVGLDYCDVQTDAGVLTLPFRNIVAVRRLSAAI